MLFSLSLKNIDSSIDLFNVSGTSWSNCLSYAEGTEKEIQSIILLNYNNIILNDKSLSGFYLVVLKDKTTSEISNNIIYDTFNNSYNWALSQSNKEIINIQYQKKSFIYSVTEVDAEGTKKYEGFTHGSTITPISGIKKIEEVI